jgi:hypothetical protein
MVTVSAVWRGVQDRAMELREQRKRNSRWNQMSQIAAYLRKLSREHNSAAGV